MIANAPRQREIAPCRALRVNYPFDFVRDLQKNDPKLTQPLGPVRILTRVDRAASTAHVTLTFGAASD